MSFSIKSQKETPEQQKTDFALFWGPLMIHVERLKLLGHLLSGLTEAVAIHNILRSQALTEMNRATLLVASFVFTILLVTMIEGGIAKYYPFFFRAILRRRLTENWSRRIFTVITIVIVIPLFFISPCLHYLGGKQVVANNTPEPELPIQAVEETAQKHRIETAKTDNDWLMQQQTLQDNYAAKKSSVSKRYEALINEQLELQKKNEKLVQSGHGWAKDHITKATMQQRKLESEKAEALSIVQDSLTTKLDKLQESRQQINQKANSVKDTLTTLLLSKYQTKKGETAAFAFIWGWVLSVIAILSGLMVMACIFIIENYNAGSGFDPDAYAHEKRATKWQRLFAALTARADELFERKILARLERFQGIETVTRNSIGFKHPQKATLFETSSFKPENNPVNTLITEEEKQARLRELNRSKKSYEWKIQNKYGRRKTAEMNIERINEQIDSLLNNTQNNNP